ncbi:MAG: hypothetical protein KF715_06315 [Candidatus Didemnitutus sp.]|nr:hypothetical protein [Candidatus Didemnitutus sp.]
MKNAATDDRAPSLNEFFEESSAVDAAPVAADYDFFGDSHFTTEVAR